MIDDEFGSQLLQAFNAPSEIALQAFSLAQVPVPYFGMWTSVVTTRMTLHDPRMIQPTMDSISDGWMFGRSTPNLMVGPWETMLGKPLAARRDRFDIVLSPLAAEMTARVAPGSSP